MIFHFSKYKNFNFILTLFYCNAIEKNIEIVFASIYIVLI
jgi:hypothetical protein